MEKQSYIKRIMSELKDKGVMYRSEVMTSLNQYESIESHQLVYDALCSLARQNKIIMSHRDGKDLIYLSKTEWQ